MREKNERDDDDDQSNSKSPQSSSAADHLSSKPASASPPAARSTDESVPVRPTSPLSPSSSPLTSKETLINQHAQQLFSMPPNEHEMSEAVKRVIASVYSEATKSAFSPIMASNYLNHHHHHQNRFFAAPYPPPHPIYFHHAPPPPPPPMPSSAGAMGLLSRSSSLASGVRHPSHHRCILPFCTCKLVAPASSSTSSSPSTN